MTRNPYSNPSWGAACLLRARRIETPGIDSMSHAGRFDLMRIPVPAAGATAGTGRCVPDAFRLGEVSQFRHRSPAFCRRERPMPARYPLRPGQPATSFIH